MNEDHLKISKDITNLSNKRENFNNSIKNDITVTINKKLDHLNRQVKSTL